MRTRSERLAFDGQSKTTVSFEIPQNWLLEGDNLVTFVPPDDELDVTLIVSVKLSYWHTFTADDDALKLTATGGEEISIAGFTSSNIRVIDITDPENSREAIGTVEAKDGGYSVTFNVPGTGVRTLLAFTDQKSQNTFPDRSQSSDRMACETGGLQLCHDRPWRCRQR